MAFSSINSKFQKVLALEASSPVKSDSQVVLLSVTLSTVLCSQWKVWKGWKQTLKITNSRSRIPSQTETGIWEHFSSQTWNSMPVSNSVYNPTPLRGYFLLSSDNNCIVHSSSPKGLSRAKERTTKSIINTRSASRGWKISLVPKIAQRVGLSLW